MISCEQVLSLSTPYVDGELPAADRALVDAHLARCPSCREAFECERHGHAALFACRARLRRRVPAHLRTAVMDLGRVAPERAPIGRSWTRVPVAATIWLACAGVMAYGLFSRNGTAVAAQLALDHLKCVRLVSARAVAESLPRAASTWETAQGWHVSLPASTADGRFEFVTLRRCLHGQGVLAHALYRHGDHLVSLFVFPRDVQASGVLEIMGKRASLWSHGSHTYAVVGPESPAELDQFVTLARRAAE